MDLSGYGSGCGCQWNGKGDFELRFTGEILIYGVGLFSDEIADATRKAFKVAEPGDVVLLSPANASWDMYPNFEVRGDVFLQTYEELSK